MSDSKKEVAPAAAKPASAPAGKGAGKAAEGTKGKANAASKGKVSKKVAKRAVPTKAGDASKPKKPKRAGVGKRNRKERAARKDKKVKEYALKRSASAAAGDAPPAKQRRKHSEIASGVMKFTRPFKYNKKGTWRVAKERKVKPKKPRTIKKEIGGDKNGGFRIVLLKKRRNNYPTADPIGKRRPRGVFKKHQRYIRKSLKPGTVCILLAGIHKGKRVVLLKVLKSGLLLINGPFKVNGCPLRRVSQNFVIATRTRLDFTGEKIPSHLNDEYFKRIRPKKSKKEEGDIFSTKKEKYTPSEQRKTDQKAMDKLVYTSIQKYGLKTRQKTMLVRYLKTMFGLKRNENPHHMIF